MTFTDQEENRKKKWWNWYYQLPCAKQIEYMKRNSEYLDMIRVHNDTYVDPHIIVPDIYSFWHFEVFYASPLDF